MFKIFFLFLAIFFNTVFANVTMYSPSKFYAGDPVLFSLEALGSDIEFPKMNDIEGFEVTKKWKLQFNFNH